MTIGEIYMIANLIGAYHANKLDDAEWTFVFEFVHKNSSDMLMPSDAGKLRSIYDAKVGVLLI